MIKPDVIVCWPRNADYPLWRLFIKDNRHRFNEVIIAFTETHEGPNFMSFVKEAMIDDRCIFIDPPQIRWGEEDWRNVCLNNALLYSYTSDWIWFTEQDFFIKDVNFWTDFENAIEHKMEVVGVLDGERLHPCSLFMSKEALNKTRKNFGIVPDKSDHFSLIQKDVFNLGLPTAIISNDRYYHMAGLSHNMYLSRLHKAPNHERKIFVSWLKDSLKANVPLHPEFVDFAKETIKLYDGKRKEFPSLNEVI